MRREEEVTRRIVVLVVRLLVPPLVLGLAVVGGIAFMNASGKQPSTGSQDSDLPAPRSWVAFKSDIVMDHNGLRVLGRFHRGNDGSSRLEEWLAGDVAPRLISIKNISTVRSLVWNQKDGWTSAPMELPSGNR